MDPLARYQNQREIDCQGCESDLAVARCVQCEMFFCGRCQRSHKKMRFSSDHELISLEEVSEKLPDNQTPHCKEHISQDIDTFCKDCQMAICPKCAVAKHGSHHVVPLSDFNAAIETEITNELTTVQEKGQLLSQSLFILNSDLKGLLTSFESTGENILQTFNKIRMILADREAQLQIHLEEVKNAKEKNLKLEQDRLTFFQNSIRACVSFAHALLQDPKVENNISSKIMVNKRLGTLNNNDLQLETVLQNINGNLLFNANIDHLTRIVDGFGIVCMGISNEWEFKEVLLKKIYTMILGETLAFEIISKNPQRVDLTAEPHILAIISGPGGSEHVVCTQINPCRYLSRITPNCVGRCQLFIQVNSKLLQHCPVPIHVKNQSVNFFSLWAAHVIAKIGNRPFPIKAGNELEKFNFPRGICFNSRGELIVADQLNFRIQIFNPLGVFIRQFGKLEREKKDSTTTLNSQSGSSSQDHSQNQSQYHSQNSSPKTLPDNNLLMEPLAVAVDSDDNIYVSDLRNHKVHIFSSKGIHLRSFGGAGNQPGEFSGPAGIAINPRTQDILVCDQGNNRVQIFNSQGQYLSQLNDSGFLTGVYSIAIDSSENIYLSHPANRLISVLNPAGERMISPLTQTNPITSPCAICIDSSDQLLVADSQQNVIYAYRKERSIKKLSDLKIHCDLPCGLAINPANSQLAISNLGNHSVIILSTTNTR